MNKAILASIAVFALLGAIISISMTDAYAADSKEKTVKKTTTPAKKDTKTTTKKDTKTTAKDTKTTGAKSSGKTTSSATVEMTKGAGDESCSKGNKCYSPFETKVTKGGTVTWVNKDSASHTVTSGTIQSGPDGKFDSGLVAAGAKFSQKFDNAGSYNYFCMVHPWMQGKVTVS